MGKHSRSRHDRNNRGGIEDDDCLLGDNEELSYNPTGDPLLDAKMMQEREELSRKRRMYEQSEDEYAGLMTQRDKQWIINIQLNQLKCDNPYVDDYYFTMYQTRKAREETKQVDSSSSTTALQRHLDPTFLRNLRTAW